jgi:uncharacterized CHY-type Zn-finger protein
MPSKYRIRPRKTQRILSREPLSLFPETLRFCSACRQLLPRTAFNSDRSVSDGLHSACRKCANEKVKLFRRNYIYGLTPGEFDRMVAEQNNRCASCGDEMGEGKRRHIDHCHDTGKIRALLCGRCNVGIAMAKHDTTRLRQMIAYLERFPT